MRLLLFKCSEDEQRIWFYLGTSMTSFIANEVMLLLVETSKIIWKRIHANNAFWITHCTCSVKRWQQVDFNIILFSQYNMLYKIQNMEREMTKIGIPINSNANLVINTLRIPVGIRHLFSRNCLSFIHLIAILSVIFFDSLKNKLENIDKSHAHKSCYFSPSQVSESHHFVAHKIHK